MAPDRRLAAIVSADVVGYSRLMAQDEDRTVATVDAYRHEVGESIAQAGGRLVDFTGDCFLAEFPSALGAADCALGIQRSIGERNADLPEGLRMEFRMGIHLGDVRVEGERIYGDGVNVAARLEGLARAGGLCVSDMVERQLRGKLEVELEDLGLQALKNIPEPVHAFRVDAPGAERPAPVAAPSEELRAIAVLPFDNMSGDPEQDYFADGIAEDLITRLAAWSPLPVIARNSSFAYRGQSVDVKTVSRELGARYLVEGSVRKAGARVRINAQLIDATTGHHLWAERYDRELADVFSLQDEVTEAIGVAIQPELHSSETRRSAAKSPRQLDAWDLELRGLSALQGALSASASERGERIGRARTFFEAALEKEPDNLGALAGQAEARLSGIVLLEEASPAETVSAVSRLAQRAAAIDPGDPRALLVGGLAALVGGRAGEAVDCLDRAYAANPTPTMLVVMLAMAKIFSGRPDDAVEPLLRAIRLSPRDPALWLPYFMLAMAHFAAGRYEESVAWARRSLRLNSAWPGSHRFLAAALASLDRLDEAHAALDEMARLEPHFSISHMGFSTLYAAASPEFLERYTAALRKAGLDR